MIRRMFLLLAVLGLLAAIPAVALADHSDEAASNTGKFQLGGTAEKAKDPEEPRPVNHVIRIDTSEDGSSGFARRELHVQVDDLTDNLSLDYFFVDRSCGGGSPRISLAIDTDGDGSSDGNAFGYVGPSPNFTGCTPNSWQSENLTDGELRWDLTQFGGPFYNTWAEVVTFFETAHPDHDVMDGSLVDDSSWFDPAAGVAYYDDVQIGDRTLSGPSDVLGN